MGGSSEDYIEEEPNGSNGGSPDSKAPAIHKMKTQVNYSTATD